jgi:hypothetical protein
MTNDQPCCPTEIIVVSVCNGLTWIPADQLKEYVRTCKYASYASVALAPWYWLLLTALLSI